ncbi:MAG: ATP-binding protein, partial [Solirubrobacterales bacterium]
MAERHTHPPLEREPELDKLADAVTGAVAGEGEVVLIEGPAGIGKTLLLTQAQEAARARGMRVLAARGSELEREFSYG